MERGGDARPETKLHVYLYVCMMYVVVPFLPSFLPSLLYGTVPAFLAVIFEFVATH